MSETATNKSDQRAPERETPDNAAKNANRSTTPASNYFREFLSQGWDVRHDEPVEEAEVASYARARRAAISALHTGERLVIAAGDTKVRSNDDDYPYRAHSAFAHLTGWGSSTVPGSLLVFEPAADGHDVTLYSRKPAGHDTDEFYANSAIGEFWTGPRPTLEQVSVELGIATRDLTEFESRRGDLTETDPQLAQELSELRLVKDTWEVDELRRAVAATSNGFDDILAHLDRASAHPRGERVVEGAFHARARLEGNHVGYSTIAASGPHACYLHWSTNDGPVLPGDLILVDAGVEVDSYYTADITRTVPISGTFTPVQRRVYEAVLRAADEAFAIVRPGITFRTVHETALASIARSLDEWGGILPMSLEEALKPEHQPHRRYMVHGTSHHLGLDVHDCAQARREMYLDGVLEPGMVFTIEPGLYFHPGDLTVPEELRGIGVRIEDDIVVTDTGAENLSAGIPRSVADVEAWLANRPS
jgi:Xaa-Pro aminopeptidase